MKLSPSVPLLPADPAVLLVLLPTQWLAAAGPSRAATLTVLDKLQKELGAAIKVLRVDEDTHPAVVRSFDGRDLPAFVLTRHGVELWRQQGLPDADGVSALLLSKLKSVGAPSSGKKR